MGNSASLPEKVFSAVQRNDLCAFQAHVANLNAAGAQNPAARAAVLEYKDKSGRTPALVAASKNHYQILQQLIQLGADIHYIAPAPATGGALHEAAARRHEATVELLLAAGACPFAANAAGRTALDEAVLSGHIGVVRAIEKHAEFSGLVAFKTRAMGGLSSKWKVRWAVVMPYFPFCRANSTEPRKQRRLLWLYKDRESTAPRCRLWVDGATVLTKGPAGSEGTLRLHTSHGEPVGDLATSYSHGYCVSLRPADLTPGAASVYNRLVALLNQEQQQQRVVAVAPTPASPIAPAAGGSVSVPNTAPYPPPPPPMPPGAAPLSPLYPLVSPIVAYGGAVSASTMIMMPPPAPPGAPAGPPTPMPVPIGTSYSVPTLVYPGAAGPCPMASPLSLHQQRLRQASAPPGSLARPGAGAAVTPPPAAAQRPNSPGPASGAGVGVQGPGAVPAACEAAPVLGGDIIGDRLIEAMAAMPGESDEVFAARLASAISASSGHSQQTLYPQHQRDQRNPRSESAAAVPASPGPGPGPASQAQQPQHQSGGGAGARPTSAGGNLIYFQSDPGNGPSPGLPAGAAGIQQQGGQQRPAGRPAEGPLDDLDMDAVNALIAADALTSSAAAAAAAGPNNSGGSAAVPPPRGKCAAQDDEPSAPPAESVAASPARPAASESEAECIICLNAPKEVGFLHGDSVHRCVCRECSARIALGAPCPLCRQPVERVLGVY